MTEQVTTKRASQHVPAFLAAGLFYLAGIVGMLPAGPVRHTAPLSLSVVFICVGSLWLAIGVKYKKASQRNELEEQR